MGAITDLINEGLRITKREKEILSLIAEGIKNAEIAERLFISPRTVETHKSHLLRKLKLKCTAELTCFAVLKKEELAL